MLEKGEKKNLLNSVPAFYLPLHIWLLYIDRPLETLMIVSPSQVSYFLLPLYISSCLGGS